MYLIAGFLNQVHHVDGHDYGDTKLHNLCGQIQVTLNVGTINDVDDSIRSLVNQMEVPGGVVRRNWFRRVFPGKKQKSRILLCHHPEFLP